MSVPAWPIPIHQTKLTMAKPHATGISTPQMPMPRRKSHATATISRNRNPEATAKAAHHQRERIRARGIDATSSVIEPSVAPGSSSRCG